MARHARTPASSGALVVADAHVSCCDCPSVVWNIFLVVILISAVAGILALSYVVIHSHRYVVVEQLPAPPAPPTPPPVIITAKSDYGILAVTAPYVDSGGIPQDANTPVRFTVTQQTAGDMRVTTDTSSTTKFFFSYQGIPIIRYTPDFTNVTSVSITGTAVASLYISAGSSPADFYFGVAWTTGFPTITPIAEVLGSCTNIVTVSVPFSVTFTPAQLAASAGSVGILTYIQVPSSVTGPINTAPVSVTILINELP